MKFESLLVSAALVFFSVSSAARDFKPNLSDKRLSGEYTAMAVFVDDGDTLNARVGEDLYRIRLSDIDAPEVSHCKRKSLSECKLKGQPFGRQSGEYLRELVSGRAVRLACNGYDSKFQRNVCRIYAADGRDVNLALVERGLAWYSKKYSNDAHLNQAFEQAKTKRLGLWGAGVGVEPVAPWDWRNLCWKQGVCPQGE